MIQLSNHFSSDDHSRHSEWLRRRQWFIRAKQEHHRKDEIADRLNDEFLSLATEAVIATQIQIEEFEARIDAYEARLDSYDQKLTGYDIAITNALLENPILMDEKVADYLAEKRALFAASEADVFQMEPDTVEAQNEVLDFVLECLATSIRANGDKITNPALGIDYNRKDFTNRPLALASLLVQEDLVLMRRKPNGWTLVAASLCFPSSWKLSEKFGKPLAQIHKPVPGADKNLDPMIHRIFDNLKPEMPVWRENWSLYGDKKLRHSTGEGERKEGSEHKRGNKEIWLRREYQTLHRLSKSGDILFTIRIMVEPLEIIEKQDDSSGIAATLLEQIEAMSVEENEYMGFDEDITDVEAYLHKLVD